jgi:hypothetical protein
MSGGLDSANDEENANAKAGSSKEAELGSYVNLPFVGQCLGNGFNIHPGDDEKTDQNDADSEPSDRARHGRGLGEPWQRGWFGVSWQKHVTAETGGSRAEILHMAFRTEFHDFSC